MKRCTRCVLPETVAGITFNQDGVCNFCLNLKIEKCLGEKELEKIIASIKKKGKYDCIVPISGGRDSAFVLYAAKVTYNLRVLAVNYDNEFRTEQALINMRKICSVLNVDFISFRSKRDIAQKIVKYGIESSISGRRIKYPGICRACTYGYRSVVYKAAEEYEVPLILWGETQAENTSDIREIAFGLLQRKKSKYLRRFDRLKSYKTEYCSLLQRLEFRVPGNSILTSETPKLMNKGIKEIRLFDYIPWERKKVKETIMGKLGWTPPPNNISTWRTDCMLIPLENYYFYKLFGCSKFAFAYRTMINMGQIDRKEALRQDEEMSLTIEEKVRELLKNKIGLSKKEVSKILSFQKKDFI